MTDPVVQTNSNVLAGMDCPSCGSEGPFLIEVRTLVRVWDDGTEHIDAGGDLDWEQDSYARCGACDWEGEAVHLYVDGRGPA